MTDIPTMDDRSACAKDARNCKFKENLPCGLTREVDGKKAGKYDCAQGGKTNDYTRQSCNEAKQSSNNGVCDKTTDDESNKIFPLNKINNRKLK